MGATTETAGAPAAPRGARRRIGVGVIGFGWLGQAHSRSLLRIPTLFAERGFDAELVVCGDTLPERREQAVGSFGFVRAAADWRAVVDDPDVDVVFIAAPNMLHLELVEAAAAAGKHVFCEKPVGGTPEQTVRAERAARAAGVISGVGYNYRWAPLVQYARQLIADGRLGEITNYRGRFFSMYGSDPLGVLSWRFLVDQAGHGVTTDLMSHSVDLALMLMGPITRVVGTTETFIRERPLPSPPARPATTAAARPATRRARSPTRTTPGCCASSPRARAARSRRAARSSGPRARTRSRSTAPRARSAGTSRSSTSSSSTSPRTSSTRATGPSTAATGSPTTASSCRAAPTGSASRTSS